LGYFHKLLLSAGTKTAGEWRYWLHFLFARGEFVRANRRGRKSCVVVVEQKYTRLYGKYRTIDAKGQRVKYFAFLSLMAGFVFSAVALGEPPYTSSQTTPKVAIETIVGDIIIELFPNKAPITCNNFLQYVNSGFYDELIIHRITKDTTFKIVQGGGYKPGGVYKSEGLRPPIINESYNGLKNLRATVAMARTTDPNSATSQFYINVTTNPFLDYHDPNSDGFGYCVFGQVISGMDIVDQIQQLPILPPQYANGLTECPYSGSNYVYFHMQQIRTRKTVVNDSNGVPVTFNLTGDGLYEIAGDINNFSQITLLNTTEKSVLTISTKGKTYTSVGDIVVGGSLKAIIAKTTNLRGDIIVNGSLGTLALGDVADAHTITIGSSPNPKAAVTIVFDQVADLTLDSQMPIKSITATEWLGGAINAPSIGTLTVKGWIDSCKILSNGNIGTVTAGAMTDSNCFAGVAEDINGLPVAEANSFDNTATIKSIMIKGIKGESTPFFVNSNIAAVNILNASIVYPQSDNSGMPFGLSADNIKKLTIKKTDNTIASFKNLAQSTDSKMIDDFEVRLY
jgi:peptidyl-prolyl cis-trans isomerase B (cyclophilin B)